MFCFRSLHRNNSPTRAKPTNKTHPDLSQEQVCLRIVNDVVALLFFELNSHGAMPVLLTIQFTNRRPNQAQAAYPAPRPLAIHPQHPYFFKCPDTSLVISNMLTCFLPLKTAFKLSSALMSVFFLASCNPFFLM